MHSLLYEGRLWHERTGPPYRLEHRVFYLGLDLGELDTVGTQVPLFAHNRFNLVSFRDSDYDTLIFPELRDPLFDDPGGRASLITIPRILGYVFNPVSFFLLRDPDGTLQRVLAEVHNTWRERHVYELAPASGSGAYRSFATKSFYVSPFLESEGEYQFEIDEDPAGRLTFLITESKDSERVFSAGMTLRPRELSTGSLLGALLRYPLLNLKVIAAIHWHALRIWLRGAKFHPHRKATTSSLESKE
jgi:DUF1365 family protein